MLKKTIIILIICVLVFPNLPFINKYIALKVDSNYYRYANRDGSYTFLQDFSFKSPGFSTFGFERFVKETSPSEENSTLYRLYRINPLCFWRWKKYIIESRHLDYMGWKEIEKRRLKSLLNYNRKYPHHFFDFLNTEKHKGGLIEALGGLLPEAQGEDYGEQDFANKMKKKRKRQRGQSL